jgi:hypothetical protein
MKTARITGYIIGLAVLTTLVGGSKAYAQFEINPDHFETTDTPTQPAKMHYVGKFTLPYTVQCDGRSLPPGKYSISLDSDGRVAQATLLRRGQAFRIQGIAQRQNCTSRNALVVERNGGVPHLSMIHASQMDLKFDDGTKQKSDSGRRTIEKLALIPANAQK